MGEKETNTERPTPPSAGQAPLRHLSFEEQASNLSRATRDPAEGGASVERSTESRRNRFALSEHSGYSGFMNVDHIISVFNDHQVRYILIGGMNFLLRHQPVLTFDIDFWVEDSDTNLHQCEAALAALDASWGRTEDSWGPVKNMSQGWLRTQAVFALSSPSGSIDIFRWVPGLDDWATCMTRAFTSQTASGVKYVGLSDEDMLRCQKALPQSERKHDRVRFLKAALTGGSSDTRD